MRRERYSYVIGTIIGLVAISLVATLVSAETPSVFTLDNHRTSDRIVIDTLGMQHGEIVEIPYGPDLPAGSLVTADVDNDNVTEVYYSSEGRLIRYKPSDESFTVLFDEFEGSNFQTPQFADVDNDGVVECIVSDRGQRKYRCLNPINETEEWNITAKNKSNPNFKIIPYPDRHDILFMIGQNELLLVDGFGHFKWIRSFPTNEGMLQVSIADIDGTNGYEIVIGELDRRVNGTWNLKISILDMKTGDAVISRSIFLGEGVLASIQAPPLIDDLDRGSPGLEVIYSIESFGFWLFETTELRTLWSIPDSENTNNIKSFEAMKTNDDTYIVVCTRNDNIIILNGRNGTIHWQYRDDPPPTQWQDYPWVGDLDPTGPGSELLIVESPQAVVYNPITNNRVVVFNPRVDHVYGTRAVFHSSDGIRIDSLYLFFHAGFAGYNERAYLVKMWVGIDQELDLSVDNIGRTIHPNYDNQVDDFEVNLPSHQIVWVNIDFYFDGQFSTLMINGSSWNPYSSAGGFEFLNGVISQRGAVTSYISFTFTMDWSFSNGTSVDVVVFIGLENGHSNRYSFESAYIYVNTLSLSGDLTIGDDQGSVFEATDWIPPNSELSIGGLILTFDGSTMSPLPSDMEISVISNPASDCSINMSGGGHVNVDVTTVSDYTGVQYIDISIFQNETSQSFVFSIPILTDGHEPVLISIFPDESRWYSTTSLLIACSATDNGSGVGEIHILVRDRMGIIAYDLEPDSIIMVNGYIEAISTIDLEDGDWNLTWVVSDIVGNGPVESNAIDLSIDTNAVIFLDFQPSDWLNETTANITLDITDNHGSGIDHSSIEYSYSSDGLFQFGNWENLQLSGTSELLSISLSVGITEGIENYIQFRASDVVGNLRYSIPYQLRVDTTGPYFYMEDPSPGSVVDYSDRMNATIRIKDELSGVDIDSVMYSYKTSNNNYSTWKRPILITSDELLFSGEIPLDPGAVISIMWKATNNARLSIVHEVEPFRVNGPPEIQELHPHSPYRNQEGRSIDFSVIASDPDGDNLSYLWRLGDAVLSNESSFQTSLELGKHTISISVMDNHGNVITKNIRIEVEEEFKLQVKQIKYIAIGLAVAVVFSILVLRMKGYKKTLVERK
jgi:hypothetical protein